MNIANPNYLTFHPSHASTAFTLFIHWQNMIWLRHAWIVDCREGSTTYGKSAYSYEVRAHFKEVLAGNQNPPAINWRSRFIGLDGESIQ